MDAVSFPTTYAEAAHLRAEQPDAVVVAGGTDVMVPVNDGTRRVPRWISLRRVVDATGGERRDDDVWLDARTTFDALTRGAYPTALAQAARTVGSPQIRAAGTLGGNLATASPAGDGLVPLLTYDAEVELVGVDGSRRVELSSFLLGPKRTALGPNEVIRRVRLVDTGGSQCFAKVGTRNAMVISICSLAGRLDTARGLARLACGSVGPTVVRAHAAEELLVAGAPPDEVAAAVRRAATPIDDHRATAAYRAHALGVLAARATVWLRDAEARRRSGDVDG